MLSTAYAIVAGGSSILYAKLIASCYAMHLLSFIAMLAANAAVGLALTAVRPMIWYTNNWLVLPAFIVPAICSWIMAHEKSRSLFSDVFNVSLL